MANDLGAKLGPRLAGMMGDAVVSTTQRLTPQKVAGGMQLQEAFFRLTGAEIRGTVAGLTGELAKDPDILPWLRNTLQFMADGKGQWSTLLNLSGVASGLSGGIGGLIENELRPVVEKRFAANPNAVHSPAILAAMVAAQTIGLNEGQLEAHKSALSKGRFNQLVSMAETLPAVGDMLELYRRGVINENLVKQVLNKAGYRPQFVNLLPHLRNIPMTPADLANLVDRGEMTSNEATSLAQQSGVPARDFGLMTKLVGVPPATELLLMAYRRGIISKERLDRGIRQSPLRSEWIDVLGQLQFDPISTVQAADAVSQNLLSVTRGRAIAHDNGTRADDFDLLVQTAGRPPGIQEVLELWNRGEVTESEVRQALLESPVKNKWVPLIMRTRRRIPPQDTVRMLVNRGVLTPQEGVKRFMAVGFSSEDSAALAELAQRDKTEPDRDLTKSEIVSLYEFRLITQGAASTMLDALGFDKNEQGFILALADFRKSKREMDAAASVIRSKYVAHKITDNECSSLLDQLHIPADARDHFMQIWALERDANQRELTPAQVINAHKDGFITRPEAQTRLEQQGYAANDAWLLISHVMGTG